MPQIPHRPLLLMVIGLVSVARLAQGQPIEATVGGSYTAAEGISTNDRSLLGQVYNRIGLGGGASFDVTGGYFFTSHSEAEFLFARQESQLNAVGAGRKLPLFQLAVANYFFNYVYNWGDEGGLIRPFAFGGWGATRYDFGAFLPATSARSVDVDSQARFSSTWGGGVKLYAGRVGAKLTARWTPTFIKSETGGVMCDPLGCWALGDTARYSNQFETSGGLIVRF